MITRVLSFVGGCCCFFLLVFTKMTRVYVGNLEDGCSKRELEREMERFGPLRDVWVARNPPGFAFVVFEDKRDAEDAVHSMNGRRLCGFSRVRVEIARGPTRGGRAARLGLTEKCYECGRIGHFARDCTRGQGQFRSDGDRSRSRSPRRRSRSRSYSPRKRRQQSRSKSFSRSRSRSQSKEVKSDSEKEETKARRSSEKSGEASEEEQSKNGADGDDPEEGSDDQAGQIRQESRTTDD